jgi:hypothetical protein
MDLNKLVLPEFYINKRQFFNFDPFYNDHFVLLYLKKCNFPYPKYIPIIYNDIDLIKSFYLYSITNNSIITGDFIINYIFKIQYSIITLNMNLWAIYIKKIYILDNFEYNGIIIIICNNKQELFKFFQLQFYPKLINI